MRTLNLGILARVDAGKTNLTERLLYAACVIDEIGGVDDGSTQTDSLALERQRGITIRSAVVSFVIADVTVNLIDTPGHRFHRRGGAGAERSRRRGAGGLRRGGRASPGPHPDAHTAATGIPTLVFVNKIDRAGALDEALLRSISDKLALPVVPMGSVNGLGTRDATFTPFTDMEHVSTVIEPLADHDDAFLGAFIDAEKAFTDDDVRAELVAQTMNGEVHPVFFGSAITGAGIDCLTSGIRDLLPTTAGDADGPFSGGCLQDGTRSGRRTDRLRPHVLRCRPGTGSAASQG